MEKNIYIPPYLKEMHKTSYTFPEKINIITCDIETCRGLPFTIQFYNNIYGTETYKEAEIFYVDKDNILEVFYNYVKEHIKSKYHNLIFFHNLGFDLPCILYKFMYKFADDEFDLTYKDMILNVYCGKLWFCTAKIGKTDNIKILDTASFFKESLKKLSVSLKLKHKKLEPPENLGDKIFYDDYFKEYAKNDVLVEYDLAKYILDMCKEFDIKIFRKWLKKEDSGNGLKTILKKML